jgi:anhydro-N-acetylmuramic acid kinase
MRVVGLMSGTSMDAIDAAVVDIEYRNDRLSPKLQGFVKTPYPPETRAALESLLRRNILNNVAVDLVSTVIPALTSLNFAIGEAFAEAATLACKEVGGEADLIGSHGQTICHQPKPNVSGITPSTLQIGEAAVIAERTGITTISDFRVADIAAGGEGAPLVSYVDHMLLRSPVESRAALNIGGIANITLLSAGTDASAVLAFDTGPGNMPIDLAVGSLFPEGPGFDRNGQIAARGTTNEALLDWLRSDAYFDRRPPKTAGREQFGPDFVQRAWEKAQALGCTRESLVATLTELTAGTIAAAVPNDCRRVIVAGGGVHNKTLMGSLQRLLSRRTEPPALVTSDEFGLPVDAKEAIAFAILAFEAVYGRANNLPRATGARHFTILGKIVPGSNFSRLMRSIWS